MRVTHNERMRLRALFGWGIVIYAVLNLVWSVIVANGFSDNLIARVCMIIAIVALATIATRSLRLLSERDAIPFAIGWVLIAAGFDALLTVPIAGWSVFADPNTWVGYALLLAVPLVVAAVSKRPLD